VNTRRRISSQTKRYMERTQKSKLSLITGMKGRRYFSDTRRVSFSNLGQDAIYQDRFFMGFLSPSKFSGVVTPLRHERFIHVLSSSLFTEHSTFRRYCQGP